MDTMPRQVVSFLPSAIIYAASTGIAAKAFLTSAAQFSSPTSTYARSFIMDTVARINAAITEVNTYYASFGYASSPNLPQLPSVPTGANAIFYQSEVTQGAARSCALVDRNQTSGFDNPNSALDAILAEPALSNIVLARANMDAGRS